MCELDLHSQQNQMRPAFGWSEQATVSQMKVM